MMNIMMICPFVPSTRLMLMEITLHLHVIGNTRNPVVIGNTRNPVTEHGQLTTHIVDHE
jgi:hypothetical protein